MEKENIRADLSLNGKHHNFEVIGLDTDSIIIKKKDESAFTPEERQHLLDDINSYTGQFIEWADDDYFPRILYIKIKNYVLVESDGTRTIKGSALKATTKEKALKRFLDEIIELILSDRQDLIYFTYMKYAKDILNIKDITEWCSKKTITKAVLTNARTNEKRIRDALRGRPVQEGDKIYTFFKSPTEICLLQDFDGTYDASILLGKLYDTLCVFETVVDLSKIPNLTLKRNKEILAQV